MTQATTIATTVLILARYFVKATRFTCYLVRSSNGVDTYCTTLDASGKATGCTCPSRKPCYHMHGCEAAELARRATVQHDDHTLAREQAVADARLADLAAVDIHIAPVVVKDVVMTGVSLKRTPTHQNTPKSRYSAAQRATAPLSSNQEFSLLKRC